MKEFRDRRAAFARKIAGGVAVVPAAPHALRNADGEYEYRQDSDLYYLSGFREAESVLVLAPHHETEKAVLFVRPHDRLQEIWTGRRAGVEGAVADYGFDAAYPIAELDERLPDYLIGADTIYYELGPRRAVRPSHAGGARRGADEDAPSGAVPRTHSSSRARSCTKCACARARARSN